MAENDLYLVGLPLVHMNIGRLRLADALAARVPSPTAAPSARICAGRQRFLDWPQVHSTIIALLREEKLSTDQKMRVQYYSRRILTLRRALLLFQPVVRTSCSPSGDTFQQRRAS